MAAPQLVSTAGPIVTVLRASSSETAGDIPISPDAKVTAVLATSIRQTKGNGE